MIRCLVVDDEPLALDILEDYIKKVPFLTLVKTTTSAIEGLSLVQSGAIDLVFLGCTDARADRHSVLKNHKWQV
jgi:two-component system LytT family response regulator